MNEASRWRYLLAQKIAPLYSENPKVQVVEIGGSVSRGWADPFSDIELGVFWREPPSEEERKSIVEQAGGQLRQILPYHPIKQAWSEIYSIGGVEFDVSHLTVESVDRILSDVIDCYDTATLKHYLISSLLHAIPLFGSTLLSRWQSKAKQYPDKLAHAVIQEHLSFNPAWMRNVFAVRDDVLLLYESYCFAQKRILTLLFGLNHIYHPGFKWMDKLIEHIPLAPAELPHRFRQVFCLEPSAAVGLLHSLIEETFVLIETHMPEVDTASARTSFAQPIEVWEHAPDGLLDSI